MIQKNLTKLNYNQFFGLFFLLFTPFLVQANTTTDFTQTIKKEFSIDPDGRVELNNQHGHINVSTWSQNKVAIKVTIKVEANSESEAQETFDRIDIEIDNDPSLVSVLTLIEKGNKKWWNNNKNTSNKYVINYEVTMPKTNFLNLSNQFGDVYVETLDAGADVFVKYGNITLESVGEDLKLQLGYGSGKLLYANNIDAQFSYFQMEIGEMQYGNFQSKYSKIAIESAHELDCLSKYDTYELGDIYTVINKGKFDKFSIRAVDKLSIVSSYSDLQAEQINKTVDLQLEFGNAVIHQLAKTFTSADIIGQYTEFKLHLESGANYQIDDSGSYAGLRYPKALQVVEEKQDGTFKAVKGYTGNPNNGNLIKARLKYGGLKIGE